MAEGCDNARKQSESGESRRRIFPPSSSPSSSPSFSPSFSPTNSTHVKSVIQTEYRSIICMYIHSKNNVMGFLCGIGSNFLFSAKEACGGGFVWDRSQFLSTLHFKRFS